MFTRSCFVLFVMLLCSGMFRLQAADTPIYMIKSAEKLVALTFDDGPDPQTLKILDLLTKEGVHATFFVKGMNVEKYPEVAKKIIELGNEIGNHSYTHPTLAGLDETKIREEIVKTQEIVKEKTGATPVVFRAPNLKYDAKVWAVLNELKLRAVNSNASVADWNKDTTREQIIERATVKVVPGSIVLMHTWPGKTLEALPEVLKYLKENEFRFVTLSEMIKAGGR